MPAQFTKHFVQDLQQDIKIRQCGTIVFNKDNESNVISVDLYNGQEEYSGGGSVAGACICPDGSTVPLTGSISGKTASVTLTGDCFAFPGQIGIGIQVVSGTTKTTVLKAIYNVELFETDDMVDPGSRITASVGQLVADIEAATAEIPASDMASLMSGIAPTFSASTNYAAGAYVYYSGTLYRFASDHAAGSWTGTDATAVAIGNDVADIGNALGKKINILKGGYTQGVWADTNYSFFVSVVPGSAYSITAGSGVAAQYYGLKSATIPPTAGDTADISVATGWTTSRTVTKDTTETGTIPDDVNYLWFYLGTSTAYPRMPKSIYLDGVDVLGSAFSAIEYTLNKSIKNKLDISKANNDIDTVNNRITTEIATVNNRITTEIDGTNTKISRIDEEMFFNPYGLEPHQLSLFKKSDNLFSDFCYHITNSYYSVQTNTDKHYPSIRNANTWQGWLIRVKPSTTYAIGPVDYRIEFLKWDGTRDLQITDVSDAQPNIITSGANSYWMCLTQKLTRDMSGWMMVEGDTYPSEYVSGYPQWIAEPYIDKTDRKTIAFMGDSITAGVGVASAKAYHMYLHERYGWTCLNYGYGGAGYYRSFPSYTSGRIGTGNEGIGVPTTAENYFVPNNVVARLPELASLQQLDGIVIFAGTNDWGNNVSIENFISAIESAYDYCQTNYPMVPVFVMTPIHRKGDTVPNSVGKTLREYADIIITECEKYGIAYVDTMTMSGIHPDNDNNKAAFFSTDNSGLHPDTNGHKRIASVVGEALKQVINWNNF